MRFYTPLKNLRPGIRISLTPEESFHLHKVLRKGKGEIVEVFSNSERFIAEVIGEKKKAVRLMLKERISDPDVTYPTLCIALIKIPRLEEAIHKAAEIGVRKVIVFTSEFSQRNLVEQYHYKKPRLEKLIREACKQSGSAIPELIGPVEFAKLPELLSSTTLILHPHGDAVTTKELPMAENLVIGPEAGFSDAEIEVAKQCGFVTWKLATNILRAETAAALGVGIMRELSVL